MPATLFKKRLCHGCFPVNFAKVLRTPPVAASGVKPNENVADNRPFSR